MEGKGYTRPPWLGFAVHVFNSMVAWGDLAVRHSHLFRDTRCRRCCSMSLDSFQDQMPLLACVYETPAAPPAASRAHVPRRHVAGFLQSQLSHPRSFSRRSSRISLGIASFYLCWILVCSHFNGVFPYPFLNKMPWPQVRPQLHARAVPEILASQHPDAACRKPACSYCKHPLQSPCCARSMYRYYSDAQSGCGHALGDRVLAALVDPHPEHGCRASWRWLRHQTSCSSCCSRPASASARRCCGGVTQKPKRSRHLPLGFNKEDSGMLHAVTCLGQWGGALMSGGPAADDIANCTLSRSAHRQLRACAPQQLWLLLHSVCKHEIQSVVGFSQWFIIYSRVEDSGCSL